MSKPRPPKRAAIRSDVYEPLNLFSKTRRRVAPLEILGLGDDLEIGLPVVEGIEIQMVWHQTIGATGDYPVHPSNRADASNLLFRDGINALLGGVRRPSVLRHKFNVVRINSREMTA